MSKGRTPEAFRDIKDWHAVAAIASAVFLFFRDILLQKAFLWEDFLYYFYPVRNFAAVSLARGEVPLWNPYTFGGMPFQADIQTALFYVPNLLLTFFASGDRLHFFWVELSVVLHYVVAGISMYFLAKQFGLRNIVALFAGLVYALSGFMIVHAIHQVVIAQVAWLPLIVLLFHKALTRTSYVHMVLAGLLLGHALLAGFPQLTLYIFSFLFAYFLFELIGKIKTNGLVSSLPTIVIGAGTITIALGLTSLQLLPTIELAQLSQRAEITYQKSLEGSLGWDQLLTLIVPKYFGSSGAQGSTFWREASYFSYWETCTYVGIAGLCFAIVGGVRARKSRYVGLLCGVAGFSLLYALGDGFVLHKLFFHFVPGFDKFRNPGRMALLFTLSTSLLSGFGLQQVIEWSETSKKNIRRIVSGLVGTGILVWIMAQGGLFQPHGNSPGFQQIHEIATSEATTALVLLLVLAGVLMLLNRSVLSTNLAVFALLILQVVDLQVFGFSQNNGKLSPEAYYGRTAELVRFLLDDGKDEYFRVNARQGGAMILDRNQGMVDRVSLMEGYTPLVLQRAYPPGRDWGQVCDMLNAKYRVAADEQKGTMTLLQSPSYLPRAYVVYDARVFKSDSLLESFMKSESFDPGRMVALEQKPIGLRRDTAAGTWTATIVSYSLNAISVNVSTSKDGLLVLSETDYPGWNAYVDSIPTPIFRANWSQRAIPLVAGMHDVHVRFEPEHFRHGLWISSVTLVLSVVGVVVFAHLEKSGAGKA